MKWAFCCTERDYTCIPHLHQSRVCRSLFWNFLPPDHCIAPRNFDRSARDFDAGWQAHNTASEMLSVLMSNPLVRSVPVCVCVKNTWSLVLCSKFSTCIRYRNEFSTECLVLVPLSAGKFYKLVFLSHQVHSCYSENCIKNKSTKKRGAAKKKCITNGSGLWN